MPSNDYNWNNGHQHIGRAGGKIGMGGSEGGSGDCGLKEGSLVSWAGGRAVFGQRLKTRRKSCRVAASPSIGNQRRRRRSRSTDDGSGGGIGDGRRWLTSGPGGLCSWRNARESPVVGVHGCRRRWQACVLASTLLARSRRGHRNGGGSGVKALRQRALDILDAGIDGGQKIGENHA